MELECNNITQKVNNATTTTEIIVVEREPTSLKVDPSLWKEVKILAIEKGMTVTALFEQALREKIAKEKMHKDKHRPSLSSN